MKTANWILMMIATAGSISCNDGEKETEAPASSAVSRIAPVPLPDEGERYAAVTFTLNRDGAALGGVTVGHGTFRNYPRENYPVVIELLDREDQPFDQIVIRDPRELRVYNDGAAPGESPHTTVQLDEAETTIVLPLDARLDAIRVMRDAMDRGTTMRVGDAIREQCARDSAVACQTYRAR